MLEFLGQQTHSLCAPWCQADQEFPGIHELPVAWKEKMETNINRGNQHEAKSLKEITFSTNTKSPV